MTDRHTPPTASADATMSPGAAGLVLDAQALANLNQLDPTGANKLLPRVLATYRSSLARLLNQLAAARLSFDPAVLKLVTHTLKSSSASIGALGLAAMCAAAEQALRDGRLESLTPLLDDLEAEAARVDAAVHALLSSL